MPVDVVGDTQSDDKGDGEVDEDEPACRVSRRAHAQVAQGDIAEKGKEQQAEQGDVDFDVQERCLSVAVGIRLTFSLVVSFKKSQFFLGIVGTRNEGRENLKPVAGYWRMVHRWLLIVECLDIDNTFLPPSTEKDLLPYLYPN